MEIGLKRNGRSAPRSASGSACPTLDNGNLAKMYLFTLCTEYLDSWLDSIELTGAFQRLLDEEEREIRRSRTTEWGTPTDFELLEMEPEQFRLLLETVKQTVLFEERYPRKPEYDFLFEEGSDP